MSSGRHLNTQSIEVAEGSVALQIGPSSGNVKVFYRTGDPNGVITGGLGDFCYDKSSSGIPWYKSTASGNTGWIQIASVGGTGLTFAGGWNANTVEPASPTNNSFYIVDTAGSTSITTTNFGVVSEWAVGDWLMRDDQANWHKIDNTDLVVSVQPGTGGSPLTGAVVIPDATTNVQGVVELADNSESTAGSPSNTLVITPEGLQAKVHKYNTTYGNGSLTSFAITHNLGSDKVSVVIQDNGTKEEVHPTITAKDTNSVTIEHAIAPSSNQYEVCCIRVI